LNRRAASALLPPLRTTSSTRWRKSTEHLMSRSRKSVFMSICKCGLSYMTTP
jgi:hypothetical protein